MLAFLLGMGLTFSADQLDQPASQALSSTTETEVVMFGDMAVHVVKHCSQTRPDILCQIKDSSDRELYRVWYYYTGSDVITITSHYRLEREKGR